MSRLAQELPALTSSTATATPPVPCYACGRNMSLGGERAGERPHVLHALPTCPAYDAIETVKDAVDYSKRCRAALGDYRENG